MKYSTLLSLAVLLSPFVPSAENHSEQLNLNFNSSWRYLASRSYVSQGNIQLDFSLWHFLSSCYLRCKSQISTALCSCACNWRWTELTPCFPFYLGGAAALRGQGGEAQPLPGTAGAFPPEAATRGGSRRQRAHQEEPGKVQHNRWEDQGDRLQGKEGGGICLKHHKATVQWPTCRGKEPVVRLFLSSYFWSCSNSFLS